MRPLGWVVVAATACGPSSREDVADTAGSTSGDDASSTTSGVTAAATSTSDATSGTTADPTVGSASGSGSGSGAGETTGSTACASEDRADEFAVGLEKVGLEELITVRLLAARPGQPIKGDNTWTVAIVDAMDVPMDGLQLAVVPWMPDHGHGVPVQPAAQAGTNAGEYRISGLDLFMAGFWEVAIDASLGGTPLDSAAINVCVEP